MTDAPFGQELKKLTNALVVLFLGKEGKQRRSTLDLKRKLFRKKPTTKFEDIYQICPQECYSWQKLHVDVIGNILERLNVGDRIRLSIVSKHWNSIVTQRDICGAPHELPWLLLPHPRRWEYLSFLSLSEGKLVELKKLPKSVRGGWVYGSTNKGSLIIVKEQRLKSAMFLVNPVSRALHKLPPLKTIPCFREFIKTTEWKRYGASFFCPHIAVDSIDSNNWTMAAAVLNTYKTLGLCRPGDKTWSVFQVIDNEQEDCLVVDILFSCGTLYALVQCRQRDGEVHATRTLKFEDNGLEVKLKLVFDKHEILNGSIDEYHSNFKVEYNPTYCSALSESTKNEVLVIHQIKDNTLYNPDAPLNNSCLRTTSFRAYKIDQCKDKLVTLQCLGDELLFLGEGGSFSLPANDFQGVGKNRIYFATQYNILFKSPLTSREFGIFYLDDGRIERPSLARDRTINMSLLYNPTWFIPYF